MATSSTFISNLVEKSAVRGFLATYVCSVAGSPLLIVAFAYHKIHSLFLICWSGQSAVRGPCHAFHTACDRLWNPAVWHPGQISDFIVQGTNQIIHLE